MPHAPPLPTGFEVYPSTPPASPTRSQFPYPPASEYAQFAQLTLGRPTPPIVGPVHERVRGPPGANLYVVNLPEPFDRDQLRALFAPFGTLLNAYIVLCFAFVLH